VQKHRLQDVYATVLWHCQSFRPIHCRFLQNVTITSLHKKYLTDSVKIKLPYKSHSTSASFFKCRFVGKLYQLANFWQTLYRWCTVVSVTEVENVERGRSPSATFMNTSMNTSVRIQVFSHVFSCVNVQIVLPCKPFITYGTQKQLLLVTSFDFHFHWTLYTYTTDNYVAHQERHQVSWNLINCFITPAQLLLFQDNLSKPALERHKTRWVTVASTGQFVDRLNYAADRYPYKHLVTQFWQARCSSWHTTNSVEFCQLTYV